MKNGFVHHFWRGLMGLALLSSVKAGPIEVLPPEFRGGSQPQVAVAPKGDIYIAFGRDQAIYCARSGDGGKSYGAPVKVAALKELALGMRRGPRIVATDKSVAISAITAGNLCSWNSADDGTSWSKDVKINESAGSAQEGLHAMAMSADGMVFTAWLDSRNHGMELWGAGSGDGGKTWGENIMIYKSPDGHICECCHPSVIFAPDGKLFAMWRNWLGGSRDMYFSASKDGGKSFETASKLGTGTWKLNTCPMDGGSLAATAHQKFISVWRREGRVFTASDHSSEDLVGEGKQPVAAFGKEGPYLVWQQGRILMLKAGTNSARTLAQNAVHASIAPRASDQTPVVAWESEAHGVKIIFAEVLE